MLYNLMSFARASGYCAQSESLDREEEAAVARCVQNHAGFAWRWRVVEAVKSKARGIHLCHQRMGITDFSEIMLMLRRIKHLEKWIDNAVKEEIQAYHSDW